MILMNLVHDHILQQVVIIVYLTGYKPTVAYKDTEILDFDLLDKNLPKDLHRPGGPPAWCWPIAADDTPICTHYI